MGLLARFAGVLLSVRATAAQRRTENQGFRQTLADACFCFLSVLPRATIQGALGADEAREDRSEARHLIFTAARLYIFCMSIVGMFLLNTFGPMLLEASEERPPEEEAFIHDRFASDLEQSAPLLVFVEELAEASVILTLRRSPRLAETSTVTELIDLFL
eukprot:s7030_g1.t1